MVAPEGAAMARTSTIRSKVAGVQQRNSNGTSRQEIIRSCTVGEVLVLHHEPNNPVDSDAVAVYRVTGEQIGYIKSGLCSDLCEHLRQGKTLDTVIKELTGGTPGKPTIGVNIYISVTSDRHAPRKRRAVASVPRNESFLSQILRLFGLSEFSTTSKFGA